MFAVHYAVERRIWRQYSSTAPCGSGYCADQGEYLRLMKRWSLFGVTVWVCELDREDIPAHVVIRRACLGADPGGWTTRLQLPSK